MPKLWRLMPAIALFAAVLLLVAGATMIVFNERAYRMQKLDEVKAEGRILASTVTAALVFNDRKAAQEYVDALQANPEVRAAAVYDADRRYFAGYAPPGNPAPPGTVRLGAPVFDGNRLIVTEPVQQGRSAIGAVYLAIVTEPFAQRVERYGIIFLLLTMAALVSGVLAVAQSALNRVNRALATQAQALADANDELHAQIEEREKVEEVLRQSQKMEAIGQLTGGVAHDFNNILQIILGNLDALDRVMRAQEESGFAKECRRWLAAAIRAGERAATLTHRLLAFARRQPLDPKPLDPNRLVTGMSELLHRTLGERITIETVLAGGLWKVSADANQLENALLNLAVNARDAMPQGGKLTIETANTYLDEAYGGENEVKPGQYVQIAVTDTGTGMTKDIVAKAFDPFFTTKDIGQGTGLGLSQVYGFVKQSAGHVKIYSEPGEGTTVKLYLPRLLEGAAAAEVGAEERRVPGATEGETVLVVEDDPHVRASTVEMVRALGYIVLEAADGRAALRLLDAEPGVRLLFTDVGLPDGMNGRQLADEACRRRPQLKVLYATGYARNAIVHQDRLDPGVELLAKPFTYAGLAKKIRQILDR